MLAWNYGSAAVALLGLTCCYILQQACGFYVAPAAAASSRGYGAAATRSSRSCDCSSGNIHNSSSRSSSHRRRRTRSRAMTSSSSSSSSRMSGVGGRGVMVGRSRAATRLCVTPENKETIKREEDAYMAELQEQYMNSLTPEEREAERQRAIGMELFRMKQLDDALIAFDKVLELQGDESYVWQRGLILYYMGRMEEAEEQFTRDVNFFESNLGEAASEERIWRAACRMQLGKDVNGEGGQDALALMDKKIGHPVIRRACQLFHGEGSYEEVEGILTMSKREEKRDYLSYQALANFYLGLWHDCHGEIEEANERMHASTLSDTLRPTDMWYHLPRIHLSVRKP